jgi:hypothetical protein
VRWRPIQPAIFGLAVLSFLLPFANVSCSTSGNARTGASELGFDADEPPWEVKGYQLAFGREIDEDTAEGLDIDPQDLKGGAEPFAVLALAAAAAGVGAGFLSRARSRASTGLASGAAGLLALAVLGIAPVMGTHGLLRVSWTFGYWVCLVLFAAATAVSYLEHRDARPPPYRRE